MIRINLHNCTNKILRRVSPFHSISITGTLESDPSQRYIVSTGPGATGTNPPEMLCSSTKRLLHVENICVPESETKNDEIRESQRSVVIDIQQAPKQGSGHPPPREK